MYFDSHAHYDDTAFNDDRYELIEEMHRKGVSNIINIGTDGESSLFSVKLAEKYDYVYATIGIHPEFADKGDISEIERLCGEKKVVAIGEIGLDYYYRQDNKPKQAECFKKQLELAEEKELPVIIHTRDACEDTLEIVKQSKVRKGVVHAYSGSVETARQYIDMGYYIGIGGVVTFKNARKLVEVAEKIPFERILLETDSPYLTPVPFRGKRNNSLMLEYVAEKIASIRGIDAQEVCRVTAENAKKLFGID